MKRLLSVLAMLAFLSPVFVQVACAPEATPESEAIQKIDDELAEIKSQLDNPNTSEDKKEQLRDRRMELNAERVNIIQNADANRN